MITKQAYNIFRGLWYFNQKDGENICGKCCREWDSICIENEPITEFNTDDLNWEERRLVLKTMNELDPPSITPDWAR